MRAGARPRHLFLYGTLMRGEPAHRLLTGRVTFVDDGTVAGTLLHLGKFPGLVAGRGRVRGEVWRLDAPEVLRTLDEYEGYNFGRRTITATLVSGRRVRVLVYRYRGPRTHEQRVTRAVERERRSTSHVVEKGPQLTARAIKQRPQVTAKAVKQRPQVTAKAVKQMVVIPEGDWRRHRCR